MICLAAVWHIQPVDLQEKAEADSYILGYGGYFHDDGRKHHKTVSVCRLSADTAAAHCSEIAEHATGLWGRVAARMIASPDTDRSDYGRYTF